MSAHDQDFDKVCGFCGAGVPPDEATALAVSVLRLAGLPSPTVGFYAHGPCLKHHLLPPIAADLAKAFGSPLWPNIA
jgi:hypothetical protein